MENERGIRIVWSIGLVGALALTLVILKQVALVLEALDDILRLAERTRTAANGIGANVRAVSALPGLVEPVERLRQGADALAEGARALERKLAEARPAEQSSAGPARRTEA
jgi:hypothetical protein